MLALINEYIRAIIINAVPCGSNMWRVASFFLVISFLIWILVKEINTIRKLPPGPWGLPVLGCLPWKNNMAPHSWYLKLAECYGDITSLRLGSNLVVCIGSHKLLKELFNRPDSTGRPHTPLYDLMDGYGIILSEGALWKRQRQFLHEKFRALGVKMWKNQRFEKYIIMEIEEFFSKLAVTNCQPVDPSVILGRHIHNVICQLMMSFRFEENDAQFIKFNESISRSMRLYGSIIIGEHLSGYLNLPGKKETLNEIKRSLNDVCEFHGNHIMNRRSQRKENPALKREPADLLDYYLDHIDNENMEESISKIFPGVNPEKQMVQVMNDLFSAGMETSRTTLIWIMIMIIREPAVAEKVRTELRTVVAPGELVTLEHRSKLAYLEAVIFETLRRVSVVPLGTTHVNTATWNINGHVIPAGTHIIPLINKINMNAELFPEPQKFVPERFLVDGTLRVPDTFMPFGVGRRVCLGEQLARMELYLFFANLMNSFHFYLPENDPVPELEGILGVTHTPHAFKLCFKKL